MGLVVDIGDDIRSNVTKRVDGAQGKVDQEPSKYHQDSTYNQQFGWPLTRG